jgi:hypothetical protein
MVKPAVWKAAGMDDLAAVYVSVALKSELRPGARPKISRASADLMGTYGIETSRSSRICGGHRFIQGNP